MSGTQFTLQHVYLIGQGGLVSQGGVQPPSDRTIQSPAQLCVGREKPIYTLLVRHRLTLQIKNLG
jgi:hypothetical protein